MSEARASNTPTQILALIFQAIEKVTFHPKDLRRWWMQGYLGSLVSMHL